MALENVVDRSFEPRACAHRPLRSLPLALVVLVAICLGTASPAQASGSVTVWGDDSMGQVSDKPAGDDFIAVAAGSYHTVALRSGGTLAAWGHDCCGQVSETPQGSDFTAVAAGLLHSVALKRDGTLVAWGDDGYGQLSGTPTGSDFTAVAASDVDSVALRSDGSLVSWGDGGLQVSDTPTGSDFTAVAAGFNHSVALKSDGTLVSWGYDSNGEVSGTPTGDGFVAVAAGGYHSVALKRDGSLVSWGYGALGQVSGTPRGTFTAVAAGFLNSVAIRSDGSLVAWGHDEHSQVSGTPTRGNFTAVAAGRYHTVALETSDTDAPVLALPASGLTVDATSPAGAAVSFTVSADDDVDGALTPACSPASGSLFAIGTSTVSCSATDRAGNTASASFAVTVRGALAQIDGLLAFIASSTLSPASKQSLTTDLSAAREALRAGDKKKAKSHLDRALNYVKVQSGKAIPQAMAAQLTVDINRIKSVIGG